LKLRVDHQTVRDLKWAILTHNQKLTVLPGVVRLSFWNCDLEEDRLFWTYQLPEGAHISFSERASQPITVIFPSGESIVYQYDEEFSQIRDLKQLLAVSRQLRASDFELAADSGTVDELIFISSLTSKALRCVSTKRIFEFATAGAPRQMSLPPDAAVAAAQDEIANLEGIPVTAVRILDGSKVISDEKCPLSSLSTPTIELAREYALCFDQSRFQLRLFPDSTMADILSRASEYIGEPCAPATFEITLPDGLLLDEDVTIADLGPFDCLVIVRKKPPAPRAATPRGAPRREVRPGPPSPQPCLHRSYAPWRLRPIRRPPLLRFQ
jgi:hypothetical protein